MARRAIRDMTFEEFERWSDACRNVWEVMEARAEEGGPRVSQVSEPTSVPLDFLPDEVQLPVPAPAPGIVRFKPEPSQKVGGGWNAARQRLYIETLAETGSSISPPGRGACPRAPRVRSPAFSAAWDAAQQLAVGGLSALAFDRAIHVRRAGLLPGRAGRRETRAERAAPDVAAKPPRPQAVGPPLGTRRESAADPQAEAQQAFPALLQSLSDVAES